MHITRALGALTGSLVLFAGIAATAAADSAEPNQVDLTTSRSSYLLFADRTEAPEKVLPQDRRVRIRYDRPLQLGGNDLLLRLKAPLKKTRLLAFEVIF